MRQKFFTTEGTEYTEKTSYGFSVCSVFSVVSFGLWLSYSMKFVAKKATDFTNTLHSFMPERHKVRDLRSADPVRA